MNDDRNTLTGSMGAIYYDVINGYSSPKTFEEICKVVRESPRARSQKMADQTFFFCADGGKSYSTQEIANIINVKLENINKEN